MRERYTAVVGLERSEEVKARQDEVPAARKRNVRETSIQLPYFGRGWQNVAGKGRVCEEEKGRSQLVDESQ